jgi:opacity protein-like surface antigen
MTIRLRLPLAALVALLPLCAPATAAEPYVAIRGAFSIPGDLSATIARLPIKATFDNGWGGSIAFGDRSDWLGLRFEAEGLYREYGADKLEAGLAVPLDGHIDLYGPMANAIYDLPIAGPIKPFIGAGLGAMGVNVAAPQNELDLVVHSAWGFAYEAKAGVRAQIGERTALTGAFRYLAVPRITLHAVGDVPFSTNFSAESAELGIEFQF